MEHNQFKRTLQNEMSRIAAMAFQHEHSMHAVSEYRYPNIRRRDTILKRQQHGQSLVSRIMRSILSQ